MLLVLLGLGLLPVVGDVQVGVEVGEEVDLEGVLLVKDVVVGVLDQVEGDLGGGELKETLVSLVRTECWQSRKRVISAKLRGTWPKI